MSQVDSFIGEISLFPFKYVPRGWIECNGQALSRTTYSQLYSIIGDKFGSDPANQTFNVPQLNHRAVMGPGQGPGLTMRVDGSTYGEEYVELTPVQTGHTHTMKNKGAVNPATGKTSAPLATSTIGAITMVPSSPTPVNSTIVGGTPNVKMDGSAIEAAGLAGAIPHENQQPFLALRYCICVDGEYPAQA